MGVSGYGTASQYLWYREVGRRFDADLVLLSFYPGNDVRNNSPTLEPALRPVFGEDGQLLRVGSRDAGAPTERGRAWSKAYTYLRKLVLTRQPVLAERLANWGLIDRAALRPAPMRAGVPVDYWVFAREPSSEWEAAWRHTEGLLLALRNAVRADGAQFMILVVTAREQVYPADWEALQATYPAMQGVEWDLQGPERRLLTWCAAHAVRCQPLFPAFAAARDRGPRLHWHFDGHWTAAGHALAAETLAPLVAAEGVARFKEDG